MLAVVVVGVVGVVGVSGGRSGRKGRREVIKLTSSHNSDEIAVEVEAYRLVALRAEEGVAVFACRDF